MEFSTQEELKRFSEWMDLLKTEGLALLENRLEDPAYSPQKGEAQKSEIPVAGMPAKALLSEALQRITDGGFDPSSDRFFGYVPGGGIDTGIYADFLACLTNRFTGNEKSAPGAVQLEEEAIDWLKSIFCFEEGTGVFQSGGTLSTLTAVCCAREKFAHKDWPKLRIYCTDQTHYALQKALKIAGIAADQIVFVPTNPSFQADLDQMRTLISHDRAAGLIPWMIIGNAGTTNTGAVDPLDKMADLGEEESLWFHVDGAYGGFFQLTQTGKERLKGMERADSLVIDPHKTLFLPYGCGAVLVKDKELLLRAMQFRADYLADCEAPGYNPQDLSPELTRPYRGLRVWLTLKHFGLPFFCNRLEERITQSRDLYHQLESIPELCLGPPPQLTVVCFAHREGDAYTKKAMEQILARGRVHVSSTKLNGTFFIRACVSGYRTTDRSIAALLDEIKAAFSAFETDPRRSLRSLGMTG